MLPGLGLLQIGQGLQGALVGGEKITEATVAGREIGPQALHLVGARRLGRLGEKAAEVIDQVHGITGAALALVGRRGAGEFADHLAPVKGLHDAFDELVELHRLDEIVKGLQGQALHPGLHRGVAG